MATCFNQLFRLGNWPDHKKLILALGLQETTGTTAFDEFTGAARNLAINGMGANPVTLTGPNSYLTSGFDFEASDSDDTLSRSDAELMLDPATGFTLGMWIRPESLTTSDSFSTTNPQTLAASGFTSSFGGLKFTFRILGGKLDFTYRQKDDASYVTERADAHDVGNGSWVLVAAKHGGGSIDLWHNGAVVASTTTEGDPSIGALETTENNAFILGEDGALNRRFYDGGMALPFMFSFKLSDADLEQIEDGPELVNTVAPVLSGPETVGNTLSATSGTWALPSPFASGSNGAQSFEYQWYRAADTSGTGEVAISGATSSTYTLVDADDGRHIRCRVRGLNTGGYDPLADVFTSYTGVITGGTVTSPAFSSAFGDAFDVETEDLTNPTVQSASINTNGSQYIVVYSEPVTGQTGHTLSASGGAVTLTPSSGDTTDTHIWSLDRTIGEDEVITRSYSPGNAVDGAGNPLEAYSGQPVTNDVVEDSSSSSSSQSSSSSSSSSQSSDSSSWSSESSSSVSVSDSSSSGLGGIINTVNLPVGGEVAGSCSYPVDAHVLPLSDM
jgi:hypothetical protein